MRLIYPVFIFILIINCQGKLSSLKDKNIMDYSDADMERLLDQWEKDDDPLEPDELPEHLRPPLKIDLSALDTSDADKILEVTKQGKNVMMFVDVRKDLSEEEANNILRFWQGSLQNNHIIAERYPIEPKRAIFMFKEGSQVIEAKRFLLEQDELDHITLEGQSYYGINSQEKTGKKQRAEAKEKLKQAKKDEL